MHRFLRKSTLYINDLSNSEQFNSRCFDYAYQIVESAISLGKQEDDMYLFNPSSVICLINRKTDFLWERI